MNLKKKSVLKLVIGVVLIFVILLIALVGIYVMYTTISKTKEIKDIFEDIEEKEVLVSEYIVYGTHLNIRGNLESKRNKTKISFFR